MVALNFENKGWVAVGDSRTYGLASDPLSNSWANLLAAEKNGANLTNLGSVGQFLQVVGGNNCYDPANTPVAGTNKYLFINFGTNDVKGDSSTFTLVAFRATLANDLEYLHNTKGWAYSQMVLSTINYFTNYGGPGYGSREKHLAYNAAIQAAAIQYNTIFFDVFSYFDALPNKDQLINADGLHETNEGHRVLASFFEAQDYTPINDPHTDPIQSLLVKRGNFIV